MKENKKKGFTLIEIIIAIFIIGLIITLANFSINKIKETGRDIKRIDNIKQIQLALEMYRRDVGSYPETLTFGGRLINPNDSNIIYLNEIPTNLPYKNNNNCSNEEFVYSIEDNFYLIDFCLESPTENYALGNNCAKTEGIYDGRCSESFECGLSISHEGQNYNTIAIGNQCWFKENLRYLPEVHNNTEFTSQGNNELPGYGVYGYNGNILPEAKAYEYLGENMYENYGVLYNWYAVDQINICPSGWHIPSDSEWTVLTSWLISNGGILLGQEGTALKSSPTDSVPWEGNNSFNFTALPGGYRDGRDGFFGALGNEADFWSSSPGINSDNSILFYLLSLNNGVLHADFRKIHGASVRCLKD
ncbi:MAG TPA: FISUMP domain-containing protein [bacterium]|nr:FISUMP domain-containing protein [bacterium]